MAYQDGDTLAVVKMVNVSGLPEDTFVNTFAFRRSIAPTESNLIAMVDHIDDFYNVDGPTGNRVADYIGESVNRAATHEIDFYRIQAGALGSPIYSHAWLGPAAPATANVNMPTEVAAVLSFHGAITGVQEEAGATRPRARRRGRIFCGPLTADAVNITQDSPKLTAGIRLALQEAAVVLMDVGDTSGNFWSVWSRADQVLYPVVGGWTDDAPDTQRRRGTASTNRTVFGALA